MSETMHYFEGGPGELALVLPFPLGEVLKAWADLRPAMTRSIPAVFTRQEWAYLIAFLDERNLGQPFVQAFGQPLKAAPARVQWLARPRGPVAVWLPNNVSLLGPLLLVLLSLTGNRLRFKGGSSSRHDLTEAFLTFCRHNLPDGALSRYLRTHVHHAVFAHDDPRQVAMAREAAVRIVFGTNETARAIQQMESGPTSTGFSFVDRESQAWLEPAVVNDAVLADLIRMAAIYGQAGCTSPRRVVLLGAERPAAEALCDRLRELWPRIAQRQPEMQVASANVMARQWAAAVGWAAVLTSQNAAVLAAGDATLPEFSAPVGLEIIGCTPEQAVQQLPSNIQTVGHVLVNPEDPAWLSLLARTSVKRFVPLIRMHHFGSIWDGQAFWQQCFEVVEIGT